MNALTIPPRITFRISLDITPKSSPEISPGARRVFHGCYIGPQGFQKLSRIYKRVTEALQGNSCDSKAFQLARGFELFSKELQGIPGMFRGYQRVSEVLGVSRTIQSVSRALERIVPGDFRSIAGALQRILGDFR